MAGEAASPRLTPRSAHTLPRLLNKLDIALLGTSPSNKKKKSSKNQAVEGQAAEEQPVAKKESKRLPVRKTREQYFSSLYGGLATAVLEMPFVLLGPDSEEKEKAPTESAESA